ncbi:non-ribosomal peptide synthetase [Nocardia bovistercoris]|uniref:Amino acid adenylation domain-containing protein n=1 Tax=Nocardia bovistercoris TaxID=2785916 RepID=A0A931ILE8_9NOCA|nr:non-ribosomal peptide synthetase [Nocardia bovistercoris]MBH0781765.1 amino acid adenylation domain-containing protein [Nocardia bovistercoris]
MTANPTAKWPLTSAQREIWFAQQYRADIPMTITQYLDVTGPLDRTVYAEAARHTARELGAYLAFDRDDEGTPWQRLEFDQYDEVDFLDLSSEPDPHAAAHAWMRADRGKPVDVLHDPPMWSTILRVGPHRHLIYTRAHHLLLDGYGAMNVARRHAEIYARMLAGDPPPAPLTATPQALLDAARAYRESTRFESDRAYWADRVAGLPEPVSLSTRPGDPAAHSVVAGADLDTAVTRSLESASDGAGTAAALVAIFGAYLASVNGTPEVTVGLPVAARTTAVLRRAAGSVSNVVPLRLRAPESARLAELVDAARAELSGALRHQRFRGEDMIRLLRDGQGRDGGANFGPAVNIMNFQSAMALGPARGTLHLLGTGPVPDLTLNVYPGSEAGLRVEFEGNPHRYTRDELTAHHARFLRLLTHLTGDPDARVADFDPLTTAERTVLAPWRGPESGPVIPLAAIIADAVRRAPESVAVVCGQRRWSYREFDERTDALARALIAAGAGPETLVVTLLERSAESVAAVWAVAKAGAAFVPVDQSSPDERIEYILSDCGARHAITTAEFAHRLPVDTAAIQVDGLLSNGPRSHGMWVDGSWDNPGHDSAPDDTRSHGLANGVHRERGPITDAERRAPLAAEHPAYLIYTSGSTGRPKGVVVTHGGLANLAAERRDRYELRPGAVTLHHASPGFDMAVGEMLCALAGSATLVVAPRFAVAGADLAALMRRERVTNAIITPAVLATLDPAELPDLRVLGVGGEAIRADLVDAWAPGRLMRNGYGPTEATDIATIGELVAGRPVTIGAPLRGFRAVVLDSALRAAPPGVLGELYIGGPALARGYHRRAGLTAGRFVADPYGPPGGRLYRTGDLVTVTVGDAPALLYHGRGDLQIKVRGHRIEPGEIETVLTSLTGIARAAVTAHTDERTGTHLVAYLVPEPGARVDRGAVRAALARRLPSYLRPAAYEILATLPLTTNGKLDTRLLPVPVFGRTEFRAPDGPAELRVAEVLTEVLAPASPIGADDDFFALGGTSLSATRVAARLGVPVRAVFDAPTVAELAAALADHAAEARPALVAGELPDRVPPAPAQLRLWLLNQLLPDSAAYHLPIAVRLTGDLDPAALDGALSAVLTRHEALRTVYPEAGNSARQRVLTIEQARAALDLEPRAVAGELNAALRRFANRSFDVAVDPPVRARLLHTGDDEYVLVFVVHHIAADGWSVGPLIADLSTAYLAARAGREPEWEPLPVRYRDYALWQHALLGDAHAAGSVAAAQSAYWRATLADAPDRLPLPAHPERPGERGTHAATIGVDLPAPISGSGTAFMVAFAAYAVLLRRLGGRSDMVIGTPVAGRGHPALDRMVGMFVNTVPLRVRVENDRTFGELVAAVRAVALDAFDNAELPFDRIVEAADAPRVEGGHPLLRTVFSYENLPAAGLPDLDGLAIEILDLPRDTAQFDLALTVRENPPRAIFRYDTAVFGVDDIREFAAGYRAVLAAALADPEREVGTLGELAAADPVDEFRSVEPTFAVEITRTPPPVAATAREHAIGAVFAEVLGVDAVGPEDDFFALGGTSLMVFTLRTALAERLGLHVEPRALFAASTVRALASAEFDSDPIGFAEQLSADAAPVDDLRVPDEPANPAGPILVTGATGFLGAHLLRELLDRTARPVHCLVRAADPAAGLARLRAAMACFDLPSDDLPDRVTVVPGDLAEPRLGMTQETFDELARTLSAIVHNGAAVNHLASYGHLRAANVGGAREVLRLATAVRAIPVHLVSTLDAVLGVDRAGHVDERTVITAERVNRHGYVASKWVAEQLVLAAGERGLPIAVYRPGLIGGSAHTGAIPADDSLWTMVRAAALLGIAPEVGDATVSLAPVDYVASALAALICRDVPHGERYHLIAPSPTPISALLDGLVRQGYPLRTVTPEQAQRVLAERLVDGAAEPGDDLTRAALLVGNYADPNAPGVGALVLDDSRTREALRGTGITCAAVDGAVVDRYLRRFRDKGLLPPVRSTV